MIIFKVGDESLLLEKGKLLYRYKGERLAEGDAHYGPVQGYSTFLLSNFVFHQAADQSRDRIAAFIKISLEQLLSRTGGKLIFLMEKTHQQFFLDQTMQSGSVKKFMIAKKQIPQDLLPTLEQGELRKFNFGETIPQELIEGALMLMQKCAYWAKEKSKIDFKKSLATSTNTYFLSLENRVIGFARTLCSGKLAYGSDMVIDEAHQNQRLGYFIISAMTRDIPGSVELVLLIHADEGSGKIAAPKLYQKFGFQNSDDKNHEYGDEQLVFWNVPYRPELAAKLEFTGNLSDQEDEHDVLIDECQEFRMN